MKKITTIVAALGTFYFANAQVGIGTPTPSTSAMLDVTATNKGVLIPRVALDDTETSLVANVTQEESLLVYNTTTSTDLTAKNAVTPGFYYWVAESKTPTSTVPAHWERIVDQTQLYEVIESQADIAKIKDLLNAAYGSNNLGDTATNNSWGGMVFTPADGSTAAKFEYVTWDPTLNNGDGGYKKSDITTVITDLINASETKTKIVTINPLCILNNAYF